VGYLEPFRFYKWNLVCCSMWSVWNQSIYCQNYCLWVNYLVFTFLKLLSSSSLLFLLSGTIGHVAHGKSTVVKAISGVQTVRFKNELERNITIKLGK